MASERSPLFDSGAQNTLMLLVYAALAIALMVLDRRMGYLNDLNAARQAMVQPIWTMAQLPGKAANTVAGFAIDRQQLQTKIDQQQATMLAQATDISALRAELSQAKSLSKLVQSANFRSSSAQIVRVLNLDLGRYTHRFAINRGTQDGLIANAVLMDANGLVGQVAELGAKSSVAVLISDVSHRVPARIRRNGLRVTVAGTGQSDLLQVERMALTSDIRAGDWLETSGLGGVFPAGITIGQVRSLAREESDRFLSAQVVPSANLLLEELLVIHPPEVDMGPKLDDVTRTSIETQESAWMMVNTANKPNPAVNVQADPISEEVARPNIDAQSSMVRPSPETNTDDAAATGSGQ
jgi:rod shape-determining protein MreC